MACPTMSAASGGRTLMAGSWTTGTRGSTFQGGFFTPMTSTSFETAGRLCVCLCVRDNYLTI